jgi:hypothetical protein
MSEQETKSRLAPVYVHKSMTTFPDGQRFVICFVPHSKIADEDLSLSISDPFPGCSESTVHCDISDEIRCKCLLKMGQDLAGMVGKHLTIQLMSYEQAEEWIYANAGAMLVKDDSVEWSPVGKLFLKKVLPNKNKGGQNNDVLIVLHPEHG